MTKQILLILIFNTLSITVFTQSTLNSWQRFYGGIRSDEANHTLETMEGDLLTVGTTRSKMFRGEDILLRILDEQGQVKIKQNFGGRKNDAAYAVTKTYDGGFVLAGYTNSKWEDSKGKNDAWIVKVDEHGEPLWHKCFGNKKNDNFQDIIQLEDGSFVAVGQKDFRAYAIRITANGEQVLWEKNIGGGNTIAKALTVNQQGEIAITGTSGKARKTRAFFLRIDKNGKIVQRFKTLNNVAFKAGKDIVYDIQNDEYAIAGTFYTPQKREDFGLMKINAKGKKIWLRNYGGYDKDIIHSLSSKSVGGYILVGQTKSHLRGARRYKGFVKHLDEQGNEMSLDMPYFGGLQTDYFASVEELGDGSFLMAGASSSNVGLDRDAWLVRLMYPNRLSKSGSPPIEFSDLEWIEESPNDTLNAEERSYLAFYLNNTSEQNSSNLTANIAVKSPVTGLNILKKVQLGVLLQGQKTKCSIPILGADDLADSQNDINITIQDETGKVIKSFDFSFASKSQPLPQLKVINTQFITESEELPERNEPIQLKVLLTNIGTDTARSVGTRFFQPRRVVPLKDKYVAVGQLAPGDTITVNYAFKARSYYELDSIAIRVAAIEKTTKRGDYKTTGIKIKNFYDIEDAPIFIKKPSNDFLQNGSKGGPFPEDDIAIADISNIAWLAPDEVEEGYEHEMEFDYTFIKIRVSSREELQEENFQLFIDEKLAEPDQTIDASTSALDYRQSFRGQTHNYTFSTKLLLKEGENRVVLKVKTKQGLVESEPMLIYYTPLRSNLHLYTFGVPHDDLKYTTQDAKDFAAAFEQQNGQLFGEVNVYTNTTPEKTTEDEVKGAMEDIYNEYFITESILEDDVVMIFLSSHGLLLNNDSTNFRIAGSDYNFMRPRSTTIEFDDDILEVLKELKNIKKFLFVDACYSGAVANIDDGAKANDDPKDVAISKAIVNLAKSTSGFSTLVSCSSGELSYEDSEWGNGAFTEALLEAFQNETQKGADGKMVQADEDKDGVLYMQELYNFVQQRVPALVKTKRPKTPKSQHPFMPDSHLEDNRPIFVIK